MGKQLFDKLLTTLTKDAEKYLSAPALSVMNNVSSNSLGDILKFATDVSLSGDSFNAEALIKGVVKKYVGPGIFRSVVSDADREKAAIDSFLASNLACGEHNKRFSTLSVFDSGILNYVLSEASLLMAKWFERAGLDTSPSLSEISKELRPGPGASIGTPHFNFYDKMCNSALSYKDEGLLRLYHDLIKHDPNALEAEIFRLERYGDKDSVSISKTSTVPKSVLTDRTVCTEPSVNMLFQLSTGVILTKVLKLMGIDLSKQPNINGELARLGSIDLSLTESWCTIDLKGASDSVFIELVRRVFILLPGWFEWFMLIRSSHTEIYGQTVQLNMISSMGNGFTFPLQTLIFAAITQSILSLKGLKTHSNGDLEYGVFGDDIICRKNCYKTLISVLELVGFTINADKSFSNEGFRESCGRDWLYGSAVRPVFCESLDSVQDRVSLINRLARFTARTGIFLPRSVGLLWDTIPLPSRNFVPLWEDDCSGIHTPYSVALRTKAILDIQTPTLRRLVAADGGVWIYKKDIPTIPHIAFWGFVKTKSPESDVKSVVPLDFTRISPYKEELCESHHCDVSWSGVLLSILGGYVRGTGVALRQREVAYEKSVYGVTPSWNSPFYASQFAGWAGTSATWIVALEKYHAILGTATA